jgi:hypothetical protein
LNRWVVEPEEEGTFASSAFFGELRESSPENEKSVGLL